MDLSNLSPTPGSKKRRKRVGRGPSSGNGKTCGRGVKGQKSRSGYSRRLGFEGGQMPLHRRLPKRGFTQAQRHPVSEINLDQLEAHFGAGEEVTAEAVENKGLVKHRTGGIKVLGRGEITKALTVKAAGVTATAREKIEKAGGQVEVIAPPPAKARKAAKATQEA